MDRSRSPRNLSDEARLLQRLEEVELPPGATDAERVAARAEAAAGVEQAANEVGEHWARAYQELHPDWQPPPTDIETRSSPEGISNQRAAELTAARAEVAAARAEITRLSAGITAARDELSHGIHDADERLDRVGPEFGIDAYFVVRDHMEDVQIGLARLQPTTPQGTRSRPEAMTQQPFTGQGHRLDE